MVGEGVSNDPLFILLKKINIYIYSHKYRHARTRNKELHMATLLEELQEELKTLHHNTKRAKDIREQIQKLEKEAQEGTVEESPTVTVEKKEEVKEKPKEKEIVEENEINPDKTYVFRTKDPSRTFIIPKSMKTVDPKSKRIRYIRYCMTEESPYVDEQNSDSEEERRPIVFSRQDGEKYAELRVSGINSNLVKYIRATEYFQQGKIYEYDPEVVVKNSIELETQKNRARRIVEDATDEQISTYVTSRFGIIGETAEQDKLMLFKVINNSVRDTDVVDIIKNFNSPDHVVKRKIAIAFQNNKLLEIKGVIQTSSGAVIGAYNADEGSKEDFLVKIVNKKGDLAKVIETAIY